MNVMEGVKVVEAATWVMGPSAGAILGGWGADVIRIEHPTQSDPLRTILPTMGWDSTFDLYVEQNNHSKRSIGLDLSKPEGREVFLQLIADADVFITSFLEATKKKWRIDYEDLRAVNPRLIYARTHGQGARGPEGGSPGYDPTSYWARSSVGFMSTGDGNRPTPTPSGGFGDVQGGLTLAGGIAAALFRRSRSGEGGIVDVSLLHVGMWAMYESIEMAAVYGIDPKRELRPLDVIPINPLVGIYETKDNRDIALSMIQADRHWADFCRAIGWEGLVDDPLFADFEARAENREELFSMIKEYFLTHTLEDLCERLFANHCVFAAFKTPGEIPDDPQVQANGFLSPHPTQPGRFLVSCPIQFDGEPLSVHSPAPEAGQHTEEVLLEMGYPWEKITELKDQGIVT